MENIKQVAGPNSYFCTNLCFCCCSDDKKWNFDMFLLLWKSWQGILITSASLYCGVSSFPLTEPSKGDLSECLCLFLSRFERGKYARWQKRSNLVHLQTSKGRVNYFNLHGDWTSITSARGHTWVASQVERKCYQVVARASNCDLKPSELHGCILNCQHLETTILTIFL